MTEQTPDEGTSIASATAGGTANPRLGTTESATDHDTADPASDPRLPDPGELDGNDMERLEDPFTTARPGDIGRS
ncbi:hypothetical protein [Cellulomonas endophytica]|uniref:hypothetical protein n=1 Tax=Cellulomonas endophytica TaxID=2494735 RepID=UPI00196B5D0A|nr:hypothetical protein [Cellulomonas endophytica]